MRGSLWGLAVVAVGAGILLRAVNVATPSSVAASTQNTVGILDMISPIAGLLIMLVGIGALYTMTVSRGF
jgi:hypothetical protein